MSDMTARLAGHSSQAFTPRAGIMTALLLLALALIVVRFGAMLSQSPVSGLLDYPQALLLPIADWISALFVWLKSTFLWLTRGITSLLAIPLNFAFMLFAKGIK